MAGSQLRPREPGTVCAGPKCRPESPERAKPMPPQPIHSAYTYPGGANASSTSELLPAQRLTSVIGVIRGAVLRAEAPCAVVRAGPDVQAATAARVRATIATADAVDRSGRMRIYSPFWPAGEPGWPGGARGHVAL